jgi:isocitrate lyase
MDYLGEIDCLGPGWILEKKNKRCPHGNFFTYFHLQSEECVVHDLQRGFDHMPMEDYAEKLLKEDFNASVRAVAIDWMLKVFSF